MHFLMVTTYTENDSKLNIYVEKNKFIQFLNILLHLVEGWLFVCTIRSR